MVRGAGNGGGLAAGPFIRRLIEIRYEPLTWRLALRWAGPGCPELAEDGLQETFYLLATIVDPTQILNLRAYFCTTLYHAISRQRWQVVLLEPDEIAGQAEPWRVLAAPARDTAELAQWHLRCEQRQRRCRRIRGELLASIRASSPDPVRYRSLILAVTERVLAEAFHGCVSKAELNADLRAGYREWFDPADIPASARHKRLSRARQDLMVVLTTIDPHWEVAL